MKNTQDIEGQEALQEEPSFALYNIRRDQIILTGSTLAAMGILDVVLHANPTGVFFGLLATFVVGGLSNEILDRIIPGRHLQQAGTQQSAPASVSLDHADQSTRAKLHRLFGVTRHHGVVAPPESADEHGEEAVSDSASPNQQVERLFPMYAEYETLRLGRVVKTGQRFDPHFNDLIGKGLIISAVQGSGKSFLNGLVIERAGRAGMPVVALDHKGEYDSITELDFINGFRAGAGDDRDFRLTEKNADEFVRQVMENRYQAIVNLPSYGDSWVERAKIVAAVGKALMRYAELQRRLARLILPCLVFVDEAQLYFPQNVGLLSAEAQANKNVVADLSNAYFALVTNGRSNGYTMCFASQSLTFIAKWAIKNCQIRVFMRHTEKNDLDECERIINPAIANRELIETLPSGRGIVFGLTAQPMIVQFDKKLSRDLSQTPKLERLRQPRQLSTLPPLPRRKSLETLEFTDEEVEELFDEFNGKPEVDREDSRYKGAFRESPSNDAEAHSEHNLTVLPGRGRLPQETPESTVNEPVTSMESTPEDFQPTPNDLLLSELQAELLVVYYQHFGNVNKCLEQIKNDKGQGLSGRYFRHASYILEQRGLKKMKRA